MIKVAIVATSDKEAETALVIQLINNGYETITSKPVPKSVFKTIKDICQRRGVEKVPFFADKEAAEYAVLAIADCGANVEIIPMVDLAEIEARRKLEELMQQKEKGAGTIHLVMAGDGLEAEFSGFFESKGYEVVLRGMWDPVHVPGIFEAIISPRSWAYKLQDEKSRDLLLVEYALAEAIRQKGGPWIGDVADQLLAANQVIFHGYPREPEVRLLHFLNLTLGFVLPRDTPDEFLRRWVGRAMN